jgi:hypothetical protein
MTQGLTGIFSEQAMIFFLSVPVWEEYLEMVILEYLRSKRQVNTGYGKDKTKEGRKHPAQKVAGYASVPFAASPPFSTR